MSMERMQDGQEQTCEVGLFRPEDAPEVSKVFRAVYGEGYPVKIVYEPQNLIKAFEEQTNIPVVARTPYGKIVGYVAFYNSAPHHALYELGQGLVLADYRKLGIGSRMNHYAMETVARMFPMNAVFGEAVCNHIYMQKSCAQEKTVPMSLEIDLMPAEAYSLEGSARGRVATVNVFRTFKPRLQSVCLPEPYEEAVRFIYDGFDDERILAPNEAEVPSGILTELSSEIFHFARVARITCTEIGADFMERVDIEERRATDQGCKVVQIWVKLTCPWVGKAISLLRKDRYFLGGVLPRWFDDDGFLMQKVLGEPNWDGIVLYEERAKEILRYVHQDWRDVTRQTLPAS